MGWKGFQLSGIKNRFSCGLFWPFFGWFDCLHQPCLGRKGKVRVFTMLELLLRFSLPIGLKARMLISLVTKFSIEPNFNLKKIILPVNKFSSTCSFFPSMEYSSNHKLPPNHCGVRFLTLIKLRLTSKAL